MENLDLSYFLKTKSQANDFSNRLSAISEKIYQTGFDLEKALMEQFGIQKKDKFITILRENKIQIGSNSDLKQFIEMIQEKLSTLPVLSLSLSFEPTEQTLKTLSEWFVLNINKQVLFDITVDHSLIAGAAINYQGKYLDFSIRAKFNQIVNDTLTGKAHTETNPNTKINHQSVEHISLSR